MFFANTPKPPYYACIFTFSRNGGDQAGYESIADFMSELASQ